MATAVPGHRSTRKGMVKAHCTEYSVHIRHCLFCTMPRQKYMIQFLGYGQYYNTSFYSLSCYAYSEL